MSETPRPEVLKSLDINPSLPPSPQTAEESSGSHDGFEPFPIESLPPVMGCFASEIGRNLCVDPCMAALPMMTLAGAAIGNTARAKMNSGWLAPAVIWTGVVCRSGERKSPVFRAVASPFYRLQHTAAVEHARNVAAFREDLSRWKARPKEERGDSPIEPGPFPSVYLSDATVEAVASRLQTRPRGFPIILDELTAFTSGMGQYKSRNGADREFYLSAYDAGACKVDRKGTSAPTIFIPQAFVTVTGTTQPGLLARILGDVEFECGLAARFLFAAPPPVCGSWQDREIPEDVRDGWHTVIAGILAAPMPENPVPVPPSDAAMAAFRKIYDRLEDDRFHEKCDRMRAAKSKILGVIPRIALMFQMVSAASGETAASVKQVDELSMNRAIVVGRWFIRETARLYGILETPPNDDARLLQMIEARGGAITTRQLMHSCRRFRSSAKSAEAYLQMLVDDGLGVWSRVTTGGRPIRLFSLRCAVACDGGTDPAPLEGMENLRLQACAPDEVPHA